MAQQTGKLRETSNAYNIFILIITVLSLAVMVIMLLPLPEATYQLLSLYDNLICAIFLIDFYLNMRGASKKSDYFIRQGGWLDLLGSIPTFGVSKYGSLLRLARLSRLTRVTRLLRGKNKKQLVDDILENRGQYAAFITIMLTILVLTISSVLVLQFESKSPEANIITGGEAFWYSMVTITTVGYGDFYPVTAGGRLTAMFIMFAGVGIIGALASILASVLVGSTPAPEEDEAPGVGAGSKIEDDIAEIKSELVSLRLLIENMAEQKER